MNPMVWSLLISALAISTLITMSSNHWFLAWLGLELNTLSILPIMVKHHHPRATEATTKYFLIQAAAAATILFASTINAWQTGHWSLMHNNSTTTTTLATIAIMMKLGIAPMHLWYPEALQGTPMNTAMLISTWQKIAPLTFLYLLHNNLNPTMMLAIGLTSAAIGGWSGLNQTQTRKIMAFSSIAHMGWLLVALSLSPHLATLTAALYLITTTATFTILSTTTTKTITDMGTTWTISPTMLTTTMVTLLSLGGLPPLTGFMPKWLIINELTSTNLAPIGLALLAASMPSLFFYTRMAYMTTLTTPPTTTNTKLNWRLPTALSTTPLIPITWLLIPVTAALYNTT
uniref:NADH-ubiquinone oxidoreductase chain 2 n=3 Tax=Hemidactylus bayonii TaxID=2716612 RepID=A0A6G7NTK5_9SAUR|nr:ND2 [Hemidactylus bayonii]